MPHPYDCRYVLMTYVCLCPSLLKSRLLLLAQCCIDCWFCSTTTKTTATMMTMKKLIAQKLTPQSPAPLTTTSPAATCPQPRLLWWRLCPPILVARLATMTLLSRWGREVHNKIMDSSPSQRQTLVGDVGMEAWHGFHDTLFDCAVVSFDFWYILIS